MRLRPYWVKSTLSTKQVRQNKYTLNSNPLDYIYSHRHEFTKNSSVSYPKPNCNKFEKDERKQDLSTFNLMEHSTDLFASNIRRILSGISVTVFSMHWSQCAYISTSVNVYINPQLPRCFEQQRQGKLYIHNVYVCISFQYLRSKIIVRITHVTQSHIVIVKHVHYVKVGEWQRMELCKWWKLIRSGSCTFLFGYYCLLFLFEKKSRYSSFLLPFMLCVSYYRAQ